jgi:hypothetical protein
MSPIINNILNIANDEWIFFQQQTIDIDGRPVRRGMRETDAGFWQRVGVYWQEGVNRGLTGRNTDFPWSAAFISYVMRTAGAGNKFKYSAQHSTYITWAIRNRKRNLTDQSFWGFRLEERAPVPGDLVCYPRQAGVGYDTTSSYKSHCDIVVAVRPNQIDVIGGNVGNSVTLKTLETDAAGNLVDDHNNWFAVIQNKL